METYFSLYKYDIYVYIFLLSLTAYQNSDKSNASALDPCFDVQYRIMLSRVQDILAVLEIPHWITTQCSDFVAHILQWFSICLAAHIKKLSFASKISRFFKSIFQKPLLLPQKMTFILSNVKNESWFHTLT